MNAIFSNMDGPGIIKLNPLLPKKVGIGAFRQNKLNYREIVTWVKRYKLQSTLSYFKWPFLPNVLSTPPVEWVLLLLENFQNNLIVIVLVQKLITLYSYILRTKRGHHLKLFSFLQDKSWGRKSLPLFLFISKYQCRSLLILSKISVVQPVMQGTWFSHL